jgi:hypothetical protein
VVAPLASLAALAITPVQRLHGVDLPAECVPLGGEVRDLPKKLDVAVGEAGGHDAEARRRRGACAAAR